jgi:hypothetical protein
MIVEIVTFDLPFGTDRAGALELYRQTAGRWLSNRDLAGKYYFFDEHRCLGGGVYIWPSSDAAAHWHGPEYRHMIKSRYGSKPRIETFDALIHIDPRSGRSIEL